MRKTIIIGLIVLAASLQGQDNISISNSTNVHNAQIIAEIIAYEVMEFDTLNVILFPLPKGSKLEGALEKNQYQPHTYTLLVNEHMSLKRLIVMIAHEFVHIQQYENEGLEIFGDIWVWNPDGEEEKQGETWGSMTFTGYDTRKFETDAFARQWGIKNEVFKIIKSRKLLAKMK